MKKSLLALAVLASIAGVASAQSSVTIYGVVDAGISHETGAIAGSVNKVATGVQSGNRLGFKGTEDLGGGLKANFQLENGFNLDTGTQRQGALFGRQAWVGLSSSAGAVNLGRQYSPLFNSLDSIDPFGTGLNGATTNLMGVGNTRVNNAVTYTTPAIGDFSATALYGAGESNNGEKIGRTAVAAANFNHGPLLVTTAFSQINSDQAAVTATTGPTDGQRQFLIGGTYNFGPITAHAAFETEKVNGGHTKNVRDYMVGATVPFGPGSFLASYIKQDDRNVADNAGAKQFALGYTYSLSKRTNLYTSYAHISNESGARNYVGNASDGGINKATEQAFGASSSGFTVGMRHKF